MESGLKLSYFEIVYGRPFQVSVLGTPPLDLEHESNQTICTFGGKH